jgi:hypothetical protein
LALDAGNFFVVFWLFSRWRVDFDLEHHTLRHWLHISPQHSLHTELFPLVKLFAN